MNREKESAYRGKLQDTTANFLHAVFAAQNAASGPRAREKHICPAVTARGEEIKCPHSPVLYSND